MSGKKVKVGDVFNETDDDEDYRVVSINAKGDPPTALCLKVTKEPVENGDESEDTEEEYSLPYVQTCVDSRKEWNEKGYGEYAVRDVYRMTNKQLRHALACARQSTKGTKEELRRKMMFYLNIAEVPSDVESASDSDYKPKGTKTSNKQTTKRKQTKRKSASVSAATSAVEDEDETMPELVADDSDTVDDSRSD